MSLITFQAEYPAHLKQSLPARKARLARKEAFVVHGCQGLAPTDRCLPASTVHQTLMIKLLPSECPLTM